MTPEPNRLRSGLAVTALLVALPAPAADPVPGTYAWPVRGAVIREFEAPPNPYGPGHRGIDIAAPFGTPVAAAEDGVVAFAGWVAGSLFVSIDHPDGVRTTYSWLSETLVAEGRTVARGERIALSGHGHTEVATPHLHFGARMGGAYLDPMLLLERGSVAGLIHLAPLEGAARDDRRWTFRAAAGREGFVRVAGAPTAVLRWR